MGHGFQEGNNKMYGKQSSIAYILELLQAYLDSKTNFYLHKILVVDNLNKRGKRGEISQPSN